jgi:predicted adenine nucleotide alpha hydrolase (AANH) superfamily ATPase
LYSKYQKHGAIAVVGESLAGGGLAFLYRDFRTGWSEGIRLSKEWGVYRQQWCGCLYSENERYAKMLKI